MVPRMFENRLVLSGSMQSAPMLSHTARGAEVFRFDLSVRRTSGTADVLPVLIPRERLPADVGEGLPVVVTGQLRTHAFLTADNRERVMLNVFAQTLAVPEEETYVNEVHLVGVVHKPPVYRTTPRLREITDLLIMVPRGFDKSDRIPVIAWGKNARTSRELQTGDVVAVSGRLQSRAYNKVLPCGTVAVRMTYEVSAGTIALQ